MLNYTIIIPARLNSGRLPEKPLLKINKIPMIVRTYNQCLKATDSKKIFVATDSLKILKVCKKYNIKNVILTSKNCLTGTDRVFEVAKRIKSRHYINVQGDEPIFNPKDIKKIIKLIKKYPKNILTGYCKIRSKKEYFSQNVPKVVFDNKFNLMYASRALIPSNKKNQFIKAFRQVCIYAFPAEALKSFSSKKKTFFENIEDIEYLRFLEKGHKLKCILLSGKSISVDTPNDLKKVKKKIINQLL